MVITISGTPGAGKTSCAKLLAKKLGFEYYGVGARLRAMQGSPHVEKGQDRQIDDYTVPNDTVIDGRLAYNFFPESFKVYLHCDVETAAKRISEDDRDSEKHVTVQEVVSRREYDKQRYMQEYNLDYTDVTQYDLVIDTTNLNITQTTELIIDKIHKTFNRLN